jgi:phospholipase/carboxylesterase
MDRDGKRLNDRTSGKGILRARPTTPSLSAPSPGLHRMGVVPQRDTLVYVPTNYTPDRPTAVALLLHGARGRAEYGLALLQLFADEHTILLVAPASRSETWDVIVHQYGPDVALIDQALDHVFSHYNVDPTQLAIGGFSDGASYALSLGVTNGDLFSHILAFSPGFMLATQQVGSPHIFISHGIHDAVLPIDRCSRTIVPRLQQEHYDVLYREFDGPHTIPEDITEEAVRWFTRPPATQPH